MYHRWLTAHPELLEPNRERRIPLHPPAGSIETAPAPEEVRPQQASRLARALAIGTPGDASSRGWFLGLLSLVLAGAALGLQLTLAALLLKDPPANPTEDLSDWGVLYNHPEYDVVLYVAGVALTLGLMVLAAWARGRRPQAAGAPEPVLARLAVAALTTAFFLRQYLSARVAVAAEDPVPGGFLATLAVCALLCLLAMALPARLLSTRADGRLYRALERAGEPEDRGLRLSPLELAVPVLLAALVYVPRWREVAGRVFLEENFLHWDYFIMGPALSFKNGHALGTEIYSAYGLGWPVLFAALSDWVPLSYGRMIQAGSIYSIAYLTGLYLFLRVLGVRPPASLLGTLAAFVPFFLWMYGLVIWRVPNVTPLRWAFDVWCFLALACHYRYRRTGWAIGAGAMLGLAVLFAIDTGAELAVPVAFYWAWMLWVRRGAGMARDLVLSMAAAAVVFLAGAAVASRGTLLRPGFWTGWLEAVLEFGGGFGMLPVATWPPGSTVTGFSVVAGFYLVVAGFAAVRMLSGRAGRTEVFAGILSLYGLVVLVKFLGHSDASIFPRVLTPLAVVGALLASRALDWLRAAGPPSRLLRVAPAGVMVIALLGLALAPRALFVDDFLDYPGWLSTRLAGAPPEGKCLLLEPRDVCGLPAGLPAESFRGIVATLDAVKQAGGTFAVVDETGSLFYLATGTAPFGRYSRIFLATHTKELVSDVQESLAEEAPDFVLVRTKSSRGGWGFESWNSFGLGPDPLTYYPDTWKAMDEVINSGYELEREIEAFQLWRRHGSQVALPPVPASG